MLVDLCVWNPSGSTNGDLPTSLFTSVSGCILDHISNKRQNEPTVALFLKRKAILAANGVWRITFEEEVSIVDLKDDPCDDGVLNMHRVRKTNTLVAQHTSSNGKPRYPVAHTHI